VGDALRGFSDAADRRGKLTGTAGPARPSQDRRDGERRFEVIEAYLTRATQLDVLVQRVVSPLDTGSIHGRGRGVLLRDRTVEVTFLLDQSDFVSLRERILTGEGQVSFHVSMNDVTAIDTTRDREPLA
jgi:hypothetical protein